MLDVQRTNPTGAWYERYVVLAGGHAYVNVRAAARQANYTVLDTPPTFVAYQGYTGGYEVVVSSVADFRRLDPSLAESLGPRLMDLSQGAVLDFLPETKV